LFVLGSNNRKFIATTHNEWVRGACPHESILASVPKFNSSPFLLHSPSPSLFDTFAPEMSVHHHQNALRNRLQMPLLSHPPASLPSQVVMYDTRFLGQNDNSAPVVSAVEEVRQPNASLVSFLNALLPREMLRINFEPCPQLILIFCSQ
jgi:hypothetical protein